MHSHAQRLDQRPLQRADVLRQRIDQMCRMCYIITHGSLIRRAGNELHVRAKIVSPGFAVFTVAAANAGFKNDAVTDFHVRDTFTYSLHCAGGFVTENQITFDWRRPDAATLIEMNIAAANTAITDFQ